MFTKTTGFLIVPVWLAAMGWLMVHDVWPGVSAEDPPAILITDWLRKDGRQTQYSLSNDNGRIGTIWSEYLIDNGSIQRDELIWIDRISNQIGPLRINVNTAYTQAGLIDEFTLSLRTYDLHARLHGERFHASFSFWFETTGMKRRMFKIPLTETGMISAGLTPFSQLRDLEVGRTWRMQVFNPIAAITGFGNRFVTVLATVTGTERLTTTNGTVDCWIVESAQTKAWVDAQGDVYQQEVRLPIVGTARITREDGFDVEARTRALRRSFSTH